MNKPADAPSAQSHNTPPPALHPVIPLTPPLSGKTRKHLLPGVFLGLLLASLPLVPGNEVRNGFAVIEAQLAYSGSAYLVNASLDYRFSKPAIQAMEHGVPLTLVIRLALERQRRYWLNETVLSASRRLHVSFHPLTQSYHIVYEDTGFTEKFARFTTLTEYLGTLRDWQIPSNNGLHSGGHYTAKLNVNLDIEALPLPLRPAAYLSPRWHLESPDYLWQIAD